MNQALRTAACMAVAGPVSAVAHIAQAILDHIDVLVMPHVSVPDDAEDDPAPATDLGAAVALTGLDAERWVNDLRDYPECNPLDACGNYDCRGCWARATGATG